MDSLKHKNIVPFNGQRYSIWKRRIRALLFEFNVIGVIDKEAPNVIDEEWTKANRMAKGIIIQFLSDAFLAFAEEDVTARNVFLQLDSLYERKSLPSQLALRKQLLEMKFKGETSLLEYFTEFEDLLIELSAAGAQVTETDKIAHLLLTLPSEYNGIVTALETLAEDNMTLAFVKTRLLDHEVKLRDTCKTSAKILQFETTTNNDDNESGSRHHTKSRTSGKNFKKTTGKRPFKFQANKKLIRCHHCGRTNHLKRDCIYFKKMLKHQDAKQISKNRTLQTVQMQPQENEDGFVFMMTTGTKPPILTDNEFLLDSGASDHVVNNMDLFDEFINLKKPIKIATAKNGSFIHAMKSGKIKVTTNLGISAVLENVLYCPEVPYNLLSVRRMQEAGMSVTFEANGKVAVYKNGKTILSGESLNDLITIKLQVQKNQLKTVAITQSTSYKIWHERLAHISKSKFLQLRNYQMTQDNDLLESIGTNNNDLCEGCIFGKQAKLPFAKVKDKTHIQRPLFIIHSDVCGPITPPTNDDKNYFIIFVDAFTHYTVTYLLTYKSEAFDAFKDFVAKSQNHFNQKVANLYCDNGGEFLSNEFKKFCVEQGISYHLTVPHTPAQNGVSERMIRTITEKARSMISGAHLEKSFWGEAVLTATYIINRLPTKALTVKKTPYELWHNKKPRLNHLKIFGSTVYVHNKTRKTKFDEKSFKGILVGYEPNGYKVWRSETEKFIIARDVIVDEITFQSTRQNKSLAKDTPDDSAQKIRKINNENLVTKDQEIKSVIEADISKSVIETDTDLATSTQTSKDVTNPDESSNIRRSERIKNLPKVSYNEDNIENYLFMAPLVDTSLPKSFADIKHRDDREQWERAIQDELNSLRINKTWNLVQRPENKNIVDCKWIFTIKHNEFGNPIKYKARLVARGFSQQYETDYNETFAPVARMATFRILLAFANQFKLLVHHMDVKTAFLNGHLTEEIFMKIPEGITAQNNEVCKLNKAIYGLKQASRCWFKLFDDIVKQRGFIPSSVDRCLFVLNNGNIHKNIYIILYVDDLIIITANMESMKSIKQYFMKQFRMVDLHEIKLFLGIRIIRSNDTVTLDQGPYLQSILKKFNMGDCKAIDTPLPVKVEYRALNSNENYESPCRQLIGCLMYAMLCTRPDLSNAVNILSRYQNKNSKQLWQYLKRVLRYVKGTLDLKLTYKRNDYEHAIVGYVDSDWGSDETDRKSTSGFAFLLFESCCISWNTKRQNSVAVSSTEAEYMALFEGVKETIWLKSLLTSIHFKITEPITIYEDNNACISIANNPTDHKRSKHIDIKYHFSREQVEQKTIVLKYISTGEQLADLFTKPIPGRQYGALRQQLALV